MPGIPLALIKRQELLQKYGIQAPAAPDLGSTAVPSGYYGSEGAIGSPVDTSQPPQFTQAPLSMGPQNPQMMQGPPMPGIPPGVTQAPMDMGPWNPANTQGPPMPENIQPAADTQEPQQQEQWDPTQMLDPKYGTFFNKQRSADALLAIGAGLLKGKSFNEGLGNAADALREMDKPYEAPTPADVMRARIQMMGSASLYSFKPSGNFVDGAGRPVAMLTNGLGQTIYQMPDGTRTSTPPQGLMNTRDPNYRSISQANAKAWAADTASAQTMGPQLNNIHEAWSTLPNAGTTGASGEAIRSLAKVLGVDIGNVNLGDKQIADKALAAISAQTAKQFANGGQVITDQLRSQVDEMIPKVGSDPRALGTILAINEASLMNSVEAQKQWNAMTPDEKAQYPQGYNQFKSQLQDKLGKNMDKQVQDIIRQHAQSDPYWAKMFPQYASKDTDMTKANPIPQATSTNVPWKVIQ